MLVEYCNIFQQKPNPRKRRLMPRMQLHSLNYTQFLILQPRRAVRRKPYRHIRFKGSLKSNSNFCSPEGRLYAGLGLSENRSPYKCSKKCKPTWPARLCAGFETRHLHFQWKSFQLIFLMTTDVNELRITIWALATEMCDLVIEKISLPS